MSDSFQLKKGATLPVLTNTLSYSGGPADLTGATGVVKMVHQFGGRYERSVEISDQAVFPKRIEVPFTLEESQAFQIGTYYMETVITFPDGSIAIFPTEGDVEFDRIEVQPSTFYFDLPEEAEPDADGGDWSAVEW